MESRDPIGGFLGDLYSTLKDRISSPFVSGFVIAWSVINYKFFVLLFSDKEYEVKIKLIDEMFDSPDEIGISLIMFPLIVTGIYVFAWPLLSIKINWYVLDQQLKQIKMSDDLRGNAPITEERAVRILGEIREKDKSLMTANLKISDQDTEIETLRKNLNAAQEKLKAAQEVTKYGIVPNELTESTLETVSKLSQPIVIKPDSESDSLRIKLDDLSWQILEFLETSKKTGELVTEKILQNVLGKMGTEEKKQLSDSLNRLLENQFLSKIRPENQTKFIYSITYFGEQALKNKAFYDNRNQEASTPLRHF